MATETERIVGASASMSREAVGEDEAIDRQQGGNEKESVCSLSPSLLGWMKEGFWLEKWAFPRLDSVELSGFVTLASNPIFGNQEH